MNSITYANHSFIKFSRKNSENNIKDKMSIETLLIYGGIEGAKYGFAFTSGIAATTAVLNLFLICHPASMIL